MSEIEELKVGGGPSGVRGVEEREVKVAVAVIGEVHEFEKGRGDEQVGEGINGELYVKKVGGSVKQKERKERD